MRLVLLLAALWMPCLPLRMAKCDEPPGEPGVPSAPPAVAAPKPAASPEALRAAVARYLTAPSATMRAAGDRLRRAGPPVLTALRAARTTCAPGRQARLDRLRGNVIEDWQRARAPEGMVFIPAGRLEVPKEHAPWGPSGTRVDVGAFYIDRAEVSVAAWEAWRVHLQDENRSVRALAGHPQESGLPPTAPATGMSHAMAVRFAREMRMGRLPTAPEFERALRGSGLSTYPWGNVHDESRANVAGGAGHVLPVDAHPEGASPFGVLGLVGNASEWSATTRIVGRARGEWPLVMGGSYKDELKPALTWRSFGERGQPQGRHTSRDWIGFRVAKDVELPPEAR